MNLPNKKIRTALLVAFCGIVPLRADVLMELESGRFDIIERGLADAKIAKDAASERYYLALRSFYRGDLKEAGDLMADISTQTFTAGDWLKNYIAEVQPDREKMVKNESEHFLIRTTEQESFLADYALDALEKAYTEIGGDLKSAPKDKISVEIYPTQESFSRASTLSKETLDRSGAIGICKFRRLMILSPQQLAFGYRWLDTLAHEYTHFLINVVSAGRCQLWMHEGIAKYLETRWRLKEPEFLTPGNRTELARAVKDNDLVPFARMAPSMVYLKDQSEVRKAFSEVAHAIDYAVRARKVSLNEFLAQISKVSQDEAFRNILSVGFEQFEKDWLAFLKSENLQESPGAVPDQLKFGKKADELEEFAGTSIRGQIRLGDRLRTNGQPDAALVQYDRALKREPGNPVALTRSARLLLQTGDSKHAVERLEKCARENPNYSTAHILLTDHKIKEKDWSAALFFAAEANAINPFNPDLHLKLSDIHEALGHKTLAEKERRTHDRLLEVR